jgi:flagellar protein FliS
VSAARQHLANREIAERSRSITKAVDILTELTKSLDHTTGGELSVRLASLYDYAQRVLLDANFRQDDAKLQEALSLLITLQEAWSSIANAQAVREPEMGHAALMMSMAESAELSESRCWSL